MHGGLISWEEPEKGKDELQDCREFCLAQETVMHQLIPHS